MTTKKCDKLILQVYIGENLHYTVGSLHTSTNSTSTTDTTATTATTTVIIAVIVTVVVILIIVLIVVIICVAHKKSKKNTAAFTGNTDVSMYASPAYGTHHVFIEPGLDHLYEPIDELYEENSRTLQDAPAANDDETDAEGYLKMKSSCEIADQVVTKDSIDNTEHETFLGNSQCTNEYVQAPNDKGQLPTGSDDEDGYENDDQTKNEYLQLKADDKDVYIKIS